MLDKIQALKSTGNKFNVNTNYDRALIWKNFSFKAGEDVVIADSDLKLDTTET